MTFKLGTLLSPRLVSALALPLAALGCGEETDTPTETSCLSDLECEAGETCVGPFGSGVCVATTAGVCGDGTLDDGEACDDGNDVDGDGCESDCTLPGAGECGDGTLDDGEACDDGNDVDGDGCESDCTTTPPVTCGDGDVDDGEECDDGNDVDGDGCESNCTETPTAGPVCGDGTVDDGEECDDGNDVDGDGCESNCTTSPTTDPECGNGILEEGEGCEDGNTVDCDGCSAECELDECDTCGDGTLDDGEGCDDGNNTPGDGCDADCNPEVAAYDGWIAYSSTSGTLDRVNLTSGDRSLGPFEMPADGEFSSTKQPAFARDGSVLLYALARVGSPAIRMVTLADGTFEDVLDEGYTALRFPRMSPDGESVLVSAKVESTPNVWNIYVANSSGATAITTITEGDRETTFASAAEWSCDGTQIYYLSGVPGTGPSASSDLWVMNVDGSGAEQVSAGLNATSIVPSINCDSALLDSMAFGGPVRVDLETGVATPVGMPGADSNCIFYGDTNRMVCERNSGPGPDFAPCFSGGASCVRDIVVVAADGAGVINVSQSIDVRDNFPAVSFQAHTELPYGD